MWTSLEHSRLPSNSLWIRASLAYTFHHGSGAKEPPSQSILNLTRMADRHRHVGWVVIRYPRGSRSIRERGSRHSGRAILLNGHVLVVAPHRPHLSHHQLTPNVQVSCRPVFLVVFELHAQSERSSDKGISETKEAVSMEGRK